MAQVALVNMPWGSLRRPSIALGILKRVLGARKIRADVFYLNLRFASLIDLDVYKRISDHFITGEWFFSRHLFESDSSWNFSREAADRDGLPGSGKAPEMDLGAQLKQLDAHLSSIHKAIPEFLERCLDEVPWEQYKVVGFTSVFAQQLASLLLARKIKERHPHIKIVFGGANVQREMGWAALRAFEWVDYVVDGEGEEVFPALVRNILDGNFQARLPGVSFRAGETVSIHEGLPPMHNMDNAPIPDFTDYYRELKATGLDEDVYPQLLFESSRGCWWGEKAHCTFCGLNGQLMKYRSKSAEKIERELVTQARRYKALLMESVDNILDMNSFSSLLPGIAGRQFDLELFYEVKSSLNRDQVDKLRAAGVTHIQPGIESLDTDVLKLMRKGVTAIQNIQLLKWCSERKIKASWNLLYGFPGEKKEQYVRMLRTIPALSHLRPPSSVTRILLQRFSPYHFDAEKLGIRDLKPSQIYYYLYPDSKVNVDDIAYYFDYSLDPTQEDPESYMHPVRKAVEDWSKAYFETNTYFHYHRGPGFVELYDTRARRSGRPGKAKKLSTTVLTGIEGEMYLYCDGIKGLKDICEFAKERGGGDWTEERVRGTLNRMVADDLMHAEKERYLSLATLAEA